MDVKRADTNSGYEILVSNSGVCHKYVAIIRFRLLDGDQRIFKAEFMCRWSAIASEIHLVECNSVVYWI